jgi:hypothetical protein
MALGNNYCKPAVGWMAACAAATLVIYFLGLAELAIGPHNSFENFLALLVYGVLFFIFVAPVVFFSVFVLSGLPAMIFIWLSEMLGIRSILFFACVGGAIGALGQFASRGFVPQLPNFGLLSIVAGIAAGSVYWRVAGKFAGGNCLASRQAA